MDYRLFGNTGLRVSAVGFGACLKGRREKAVLCTKYGHADPENTDFSATGLRISLEASLHRLQTDHVDLLLLHNPPGDLLDGIKASDLYAELEALRREGKLRAYGASIDTGHELRTLAQTTTSGAAEVLFNAFHQDVRRAFGDAAHRGVGLVAKVPLDSGWLSGKYDEHSRFDGIRARWSPEVVARRAALVRKLRSTGGQPGRRDRAFAGSLGRGHPCPAGSGTRGQSAALVDSQNRNPRLRCKPAYSFLLTTRRRPRDLYFTPLVVACK